MGDSTDCTAAAVIFVVDHTADLMTDCAHKDFVDGMDSLAAAAVADFEASQSGFAEEYAVVYSNKFAELESAIFDKGSIAETAAADDNTLAVAVSCCHDRMDFPGAFEATGQGSPFADSDEGLADCSCNLEFVADAEQWHVGPLGC